MSTQPQTGGKNTPVAAIANGFVVVHCPNLHCCQFIHAPETNWHSAINHNKATGILAQTRRNNNKGNASIGRSQRMTVEIESPLPPHPKANSSPKTQRHGQHQGHNHWESGDARFSFVHIHHFSNSRE
jgi:hypothetical protein